MTDDPAVRCLGCEFTWRSAAMAEGLRVLGACPKCKGELRFRDAAEDAAPAPADAPVPQGAPHLVLGIPRL